MYRYDWPGPVGSLVTEQDYIAEVHHIYIFERVVKMKSYLSLMKMQRLDACLFFGYLEAGKLEIESTIGAAGGSRT